MKKKLVRLLVQTAVLLLVEEVLQVLGLLQRMGQQIQNRMRLPMRLLLRLVEVVVLDVAGLLLWRLFHDRPKLGTADRPRREMARSRDIDIV